MFEYAHFVPGRLRLKSSGPRDHRDAIEAQAFAAEIPSVRTVAANPATGSLTIIFDQQQLSIGNLWELLRGAQYVSGRCPEFPDGRSQSGFGIDRFGRAVIDALVEALVRHSAYALVKGLF
jgi:hypothetical protein